MLRVDAFLGSLLRDPPLGESKMVRKVAMGKMPRKGKKRSWASKAARLEEDGGRGARGG